MSGVSVYVAGHLAKWQRARALMEALREAGHRVTFDWTQQAERREHGERLSDSAAADLAQECVYGVRDAEQCIWLTHPDSIGAFLEAGMAIGTGTPLWIVLDWEPPNDQFEFWARLPLVEILHSEDEARERFGAALLLSTLRGKGE
jgi:hypothetical protein